MRTRRFIALAGALLFCLSVAACDGCSGGGSGSGSSGMCKGTLLKF
jgi:hypothetical protein